MQICIKGGMVFDGHSFSRKDILIESGRIVSVTECGAADFLQCDAVYDLKDKYVFPGFVDVHVHFREPGFSYKETCETGAAAAAAGGYTDVCTMPNLNPVPDSGEHLKEELEAIGRAKGCGANIYPYGSLTVGEMGAETADLEEMAENVIAFSDDGKGLSDDAVMKDAMRRAKKLGKVVAAHCEDLSVIKGSCVHDGKAAEKLKIDGITSESEWKMIQRDIKLAAETGCSYHVCHISTAESVELIRNAKKAGIDVTCETAPHYILLSEEDIVEALETADQAKLGRFKMNPPLRSEKDRKAILEGIIDGTIDMIATDHAPHSPEEKSKGLLGAPMGVVGLECAFPVLYTGLVRTGMIKLERLAELMSIRPALRFGIECGIIPGNTAKLSVWDLEKEYVIRTQDFRSKGRSTPFEGRRVSASRVLTVCGEYVFE